MRVANTTPFEAGAYAVADRDGADLLLVVVRGTYVLDGRGRLGLADAQTPVTLEDTYTGEPGASGLAAASDFALGKPATDVVLTGHAYADRPGATSVDVGLQVGPVRRLLRVFGDRFWRRSMGALRMSAPAPFARMPLVYERAFGGVDATADDPRHHEAEARNPVGVGFRARRGARPDDAPLPNLEDLGALITTPDDRPAPAAPGPVPPAWAPRAAYAGTYDAAWEATRRPLLPLDFDARFFNAAAPGLVAPGRLRGDEPVALIGVSPDGPLRFALPGVTPGGAAVSRTDGARPLAFALDTVALAPDDRRVTLVWSATAAVRRGFADVEAVRCSLP